jgi:hypothetical protein
MTDLHPIANELVVHPIAAIGFMIVAGEETTKGLDVPLHRGYILSTI